ncbi:MAG: glycoside hydrolase family 5 protein [Lachnospiraceae bacterium]|nr:glycoside hydrolase family 5 protein [Lachnospiraceae bacterium]MBR1855295.1 glycoside hydrolase family 5 protein [Lachnospiraceae bacterium]
MRQIKKMKNMIYLFLAASLICCITACGIQNAGEDSVGGLDVPEESDAAAGGVKASLPGTGGAERETMPTQPQTEQAASAQPQTGLVTSVQSQSETARQLSVTGQSAQAFVENLGVGWNLGNTLDPVDCTWLADNMEMEYETAWGNPKATKELIHYIKSEGFTTIRIPVTWKNHVDAAPAYTIHKQWLDRVQQVVDWCREEELYVILNIHHESSWLTNASKDYEQTMAQYCAIWTQLAARFQDYDEHLIFESMNEIGFDDLGDVKGCELQNRINAEFTELIRTSGGKNSDRYLLLAGYWTDIDKTCAGSVLPEDDRVILSVHYYSPASFAIADRSSSWGYQETWGTDADFAYLDGQMRKLKEHFADKGTPVIIGEFAATHTDKDAESVVRYTAAVMEYALRYHFCPIWWDNGQEIDRTALRYRLDGMQEAIHTVMKSDN